MDPLSDVAQECYSDVLDCARTFKLRCLGGWGSVLKYIKVRMARQLGNTYIVVLARAASTVRMRPWKDGFSYDGILSEFQMAAQGRIVFQLH